MPGVGARAERVHVNDLIDKTNGRSLDDYNILAIPGGFSYGDDIAAGKALASKLRHHLSEELDKFVADGKLIILSDKGTIVIAEATAEGFKQLAAGQVVKGPCWTVPALANGKIYARAKTGMLSCSTFQAK